MLESLVFLQCGHELAMGQPEYFHSFSESSKCVGSFIRQKASSWPGDGLFSVIFEVFELLSFWVTVALIETNSFLRSGQFQLKTAVGLMLHTWRS